jgi:hypothetical protein
MFEVINGGKDPSTPTPADMKSKLRQLTFLDHLRIRRQHATFGPRFALAVLFGPAVCLSVILILFLAESNGLLIWSEIKSGAVRRGLYLSPYILGLAAFVIAILKSKRPETWHAYIDEKLNQYEPVDKIAYRNLQQRTRDGGFLSSDHLHEWICTERGAINVALGYEAQMSAAFLRKKV